MSDEKQGKGIRIGGAWKVTDSEGKVKALRLPLTPTCTLVLFPNTRREKGSKQPHFNAYLYPVEPRAKQDEKPGVPDPFDAKNDVDDGFPF